MIMGVTNNFERKLFFVFGRHIWNVIGVSRFPALLAGCILFVESFSTTNLKVKNNIFEDLMQQHLKVKKNTLEKIC